MTSMKKQKSPYLLSESSTASTQTHSTVSHSPSSANPSTPSSPTTAPHSSPSIRSDHLKKTLTRGMLRFVDLSRSKFFIHVGLSGPATNWPNLGPVQRNGDEGSGCGCDCGGHKSEEVAAGEVQGDYGYEDWV
ncbi:hypothetical protein RHSIM_Rhsim08G0195000 [Rhododendron simsii]|uniref:Uncharacterized protein n=1 Tax=Rhododendron simsii TaxID=118357 RepID=A0A834LIP8_RHOSS|nr:hypothetical protein RHSIM_Rhsim08G0195000 [Rhododendron simsii]